MTDSEHVFKKTGAMYLEQIMAMPRDRLKKMDKIHVRNQIIDVPFFNGMVSVSEKGMFDETQKSLSFDEKVVLARYLLMCGEDAEAKKDWVAFRDIKGAGPLTVYYRDNVEHVIVKHFSGRINDLTQALLILGAFAPDDALSNDLVMAVEALPGLLLLLLFNDAEDGFSASCSVLFNSRSDRFLDPESLAILGAVFARRLTKPMA